MRITKCEDGRWMVVVKDRDLILYANTMQEGIELAWNVVKAS